MRFRNYWESYDKLKEIYISDINKRLRFIKQVLHSVMPFYNKNPPKHFFSKWMGVKKCYDSGGFAFLMGNISEEKLNPDRTIQIYHQLGYEKDDILLQLDLPPYYFTNKEKRRELIDKNVRYYFYQKSKIKNIVPIIHGWEKAELNYNLQKLNGTISKTVATCYNGNLVAIGSNLALSKSKQIAMGSYLATSKDKKRRVSFEKVLKHIYYALKVLKNYEVIVLGAGNINISHILFSLGAKATDGCSWRIDAAFNRFYIPGKTPVSFWNGKRYTGRKPNDEDFKILQEVHSEKEHPYSYLSFDKFLDGLKKKSTVRQYHNAFVLYLEEKIANLFENAPDRYFKYLENRFQSYSNKRHLNVLKYLHKRMKYPYIQHNLEVFIKD